MTEAAWPKGPNASRGAQEPPWNLSSSSPAPWATVGHPAWTPTVAAILLLALLGNGLLLYRLRCGGRCCEKRRRKKADFLLAHLAAADLCCGGLSLVPQLWPSEPAAGDATCRLLRVLQGWGLLAPPSLLVLIAFERRGLVAPSGPSARRLPRPALASLGWLLPLLLALPQAAVFRLRAGGRCLATFRLPAAGRAYAAYWALAGFVAPACLLGAACGRILWSLRASEEGPGEEERKGEASPAAPPPPRRPPWLLRCLPPRAKGATSPPSPPSPPPPPPPRSLPRARTRALHLALALSALFALCGLPRLALELAAPAPEGPPTAQGALLAAAHAALNPFACLLFRSRRPWARRLQRGLCRCPERPRRPRWRAARPRRQPPLRSPAPERQCPCQESRPPPSSAARALEPREGEGEEEGAL